MAETRRDCVTLAALLAVLQDGDRLFIVHRMGPHECEGVAGGTAREPRLYRYACGSLKGRGPHFAKRTIKRWRDEYKGKRFYVAELDIKGFYDNVDTEILKAMLRKKIRDKQYLTVLFHVIDGGAPGLPKGFYTSPWLAHFLLTPFDNYITQTLRPEPEPSAPVESQQPDPSPEPDKSDNGGGLLAVVGLVLLAGGGAAYFVMFKKKKPDVKGSADLDEYDYGDEDDPDDGPEGGEDE